MRFPWGISSTGGTATASAKGSVVRSGHDTLDLITVLARTRVGFGLRYPGEQ